MQKSMQAVAKAMGQEGSFSGQVASYCIDSRLIQEGSLFFALKGERVDGHDYLKDVAQKKGAGAVVEISYQGEDFGLQLIRVSNVRLALQKLAKAELASRDCRVIGVTGSVGKTTTKEFLAKLLKKKYRIFKSPFSYNSQVTLPLSILNSAGDEELLLLEMAMSEKGNIKRLIEIAPVDFALITKIGKTHTEFFSDGIEGVARAKGEILESPKLQLAIVHHSAMQYSSISKRGECEKVTFGKEGEDYLLKQESGLFYFLEKGVESTRFALPFTAEHLCSNFLAAAAMARVLGMSFDEIIERSSELKPVVNRFETIVQNGVTFVNDSYNASAESTTAALANLPKPQEGGKTVFVFGEMRELGAQTKQSHAEVGEAAKDVIDHLLCLGKECQPTMDALLEKGKMVDLCTDFDVLKKMLFRTLKKGDVVLIKGANSHQLWRILERE